MLCVSCVGGGGGLVVKKQIISIRWYDLFPSRNYRQRSLTGTKP